MRDRYLRYLESIARFVTPEQQSAVAALKHHGLEPAGGPFFDQKGQAFFLCQRFVRRGALKAECEIRFRLRPKSVNVVTQWVISQCIGPYRVDDIFPPVREALGGAPHGLRRRVSVVNTNMKRRGEVEELERGGPHRAGLYRFKGDPPS